VAAGLRAKKATKFDLNVRELVEWNRIARFRYPYERRQDVKRPELRIQDYLRVLSRQGVLQELDADVLRRQTVDAIDPEGDLAYRWNLWRCLTGEVKEGQRVFILDDGQWYEIAHDYLVDLDRFIDREVPTTSLTLPTADPTWTDDIYNAEAASTHDLLLLDRQTVRINRSTSPIEICDLLSTGRQLVHVKRHLGSSMLSHLFAQGLVSADLLLTSSEFQAAAATRIAAVQEARRIPGDFDFFFGGAIDPSRFEVIYAIVANWRRRSLAKSLPFFSKVNLRRCVEDLHRRRFLVTHARVQTRTQS
jgi:uncharacterized protein (TIGR04141 family)